MKIQIDTVSEDELKQALIEALGEPGADKETLSLPVILAEYHECARLEDAIDQFLGRRKSRDIDLGPVGCRQSRDIDVGPGRMLLDRMAELQEKDVRKPKSLILSVNIKVKQVVVPDPERDEVVLVAAITSGCHVSDFAAFVVQEHLLSEEACNEAIARWQTSDTLIGRIQEERNLIEAVLSVFVEPAISSQPMSVRHNIGATSGYLWRTSDESITVPSLFDLSRFPFDRSLVDFRLRPNVQDTWDSWLVPDSSPSVTVLTAIAPRGFCISAAIAELYPVINSPSRDVWPEGALCARFTMRRLPGTVFWRIMVPTFIVLGLTFLAALIAIGGGLYRETVTTQMLPTALVALVALQLTASQFTPAQSGRTLLDTLYIVTYLAVIALFVALVYMPGLIGLIALVAALVAPLILAGLTLHAWWLWRKA